MPQSKSNINVSINRDTHARLLKIGEHLAKEVKRQNKVDVRYSLDTVISILIDAYSKSRKGS